MMVSEEQRDALAQKLLQRHLVANRDEALTLATKFLEMDVSYADDPKHAAVEQRDDRAEPQAAEQPSATAAAAPLEANAATHEESAAVVGSTMESAENAKRAYVQVLYYEQLKLEPKGTAPFPNARTQPVADPAPAPRAQASSHGAEAMERLQNTKVDITNLFNVNNMAKQSQES